jgi:hypothetical protein
MTINCHEDAGFVVYGSRGRKEGTAKKVQVRRSARVFDMALHFFKKKKRDNEYNQLDHIY